MLCNVAWLQSLLRVCGLFQLQLFDRKYIGENVRNHTGWLKVPFRFAHIAFDIQ